MILRDDIDIQVAAGFVNEVRHPSLPLTLYNYSARCQYERIWNDVTVQCRGLVLGDDGSVVARPFRKFFNDSEHPPEQIPWHLPCEITEKMDGSLGILFYACGRWNWATRGSFTSSQSVEAAAIFAEKYGDATLNEDVTYLFEIIYPENRIVVDYGGRRDVVLLGMIHYASNIELPLDEAPSGLTVVRRASPASSFAELRTVIKDDEEGYVVRFENGFRVKVKGERYVELHRIMSGVSSRSVWETLAAGKSFDELLAVVPDECGDWVRSERSGFLADFDALEYRAKAGYEAVRNLPNRKEKAAVILRDFANVSSLCFAMLDGKDYVPMLWRQLYPECRRPAVVARIES